MEERRGRPKETHFEDTPRQFERVFKDPDGVISTWKYDLDKQPNGPIEVNNEYPKDFKPETEDEKLEKQNKDLPLTKRQWINPANGKLVGYTRAKALNLIK